MRTAAWLAGLMLLATPVIVHAQPKKAEPLAEQVKQSIDKGVAYLRNSSTNGTWEHTLKDVGHPGGATALALLALLNAGVPADDPLIQKGMDYLRKLDYPTTYVRSLQTMVYVEAGQFVDGQRIQNNINHLIEKRVGKPLEGWSYDRPGGTVDNSNTQFALLALHYGKLAGAKIDPSIWKEIQDFYIRTQQKDGGWRYAAGGADRSRLTMTTAGLCGLLISGMELNQGREEIGLNGVAKNCGDYRENEPVQRALAWISGPGGGHFTIEFPGATFYNLYGIERAGRLSGLRFFGDHDWYREGCEWLISKQKDDGRWQEAGGNDNWPTVSTGFALLFLSKGRTPILISKLAHGLTPRQFNDQDWNNDRNDLRHLVDYASKNLFKKLPLAWQNFDMLKAAKGQVLNEDDLLDVTSDMLQSPIIYFNGHKAPRFSDLEKELLKRYVDYGGFIVVEACCGDARFDRGFRALAEELWPETKLEPLSAEHPIWKMHFPVPPGSFKLEGIQRGCKTVLVYSPEDMSCLWEANRMDTAKGELAFRLGANIIAYATGMEPPRPRLAKVELANTKNQPREIQRNVLKAGQLKHTGDWQPAPKAMSNLLAHLRKLAGLDVDLRTEAMGMSEKALIDFKFLYMHGRKDFNVQGEDLSHLRFNLENGGLLLADACCGSEAFDKAFRKFVAELLPKHKLETIQPTEEVKGEYGLLSKAVNGEELTAANIRLRLKRGGEFMASPPQLEGIKIQGRWVVIYSKYDLGCALERHASADCLGYNHDSALRIAGAAVLYALRP